MPWSAPARRDCRAGVRDSGSPRRRRAVQDGVRGRVDRAAPPDRPRQPRPAPRAAPRPAARPRIRRSLQMASRPAASESAPRGHVTSASLWSAAPATLRSVARTRLSRVRAAGADGCENRRQSPASGIRSTARPAARQSASSIETSRGSGGKRLMATTVRTRTATGRSSIHSTTSGGTSTGSPERGSLVWGAARSSTSSEPRLRGLACRNACTARRSPIKLSPLPFRGLRAALPCAVRPVEGMCDRAVPPVRNVSMDVVPGT